MISPINVEIKNALKFNQLLVNDYFIFLDNNLKTTVFFQKSSNNTFVNISTADSTTLSKQGTNLPVIQLLLPDYLIDLFQSDQSNIEPINIVFPKSNDTVELSEAEKYQLEIKRLEKIIINQAEIIGELSNAKKTS